MSETTNETPDNVTPDMAQEATQEGQEPTGDKGGNAEAARYRTQLRAVESERDALVARVEAFQKADAERMAGETLANGEDLWLTGLSVDHVLDDDGRVDPDVVAAKVQEITRERPHFARLKFGNIDQGPQGSGKPKPTFADALRGRTR